MQAPVLVKPLQLNGKARCKGVLDTKSAEQLASVIVEIENNGGKATGAKTDVAIRVTWLCW